MLVFLGGGGWGRRWEGAVLNQDHYSHPPARIKNSWHSTPCVPYACWACLQSPMPAFHIPAPALRAWHVRVWLSYHVQCCPKGAPSRAKCLYFRFRFSYFCHANEGAPNKREKIEKYNTYMQLRTYWTHDMCICVTFAYLRTLLTRPQYIVFVVKLKQA